MGPKTLSKLLIGGILILASCSQNNTDESSSKNAEFFKNCIPTQTSGATSGDGVVFPLRDSLPNKDGSSSQVKVSGYVLSKNCKPLPEVLVKFWSASKNGEYTEDSYGSVYTNKLGFYSFTAPYPGEYLPTQGSAHIHLSATIDGLVITTEVFPKSSELDISLNLVAGFKDISKTPDSGQGGV